MTSPLQSVTLLGSSSDCPTSLLPHQLLSTTAPFSTTAPSPSYISLLQDHFPATALYYSTISLLQLPTTGPFPHYSSLLQHHLPPTAPYYRTISPLQLSTTAPSPSYSSLLRPAPVPHYSSLLQHHLPPTALYYSITAPSPSFSSLLQHQLGVLTAMSTMQSLPCRLEG